MDVLYIYRVTQKRPGFAAFLPILVIFFINPSWIPLLLKPENSNFNPEKTLPLCTAMIGYPER